MKSDFSELIRRISFSCLFMFLFAVLSGQKAADFSGTWQMDVAKSDTNYEKYYSALTCVIRQTPQAITIERISVDKAGKKSSQEPVVYTLDGRETAKEQYGGTDKYLALWSDDKMKLTLRCRRTVEGTDYGSNESYTLSANGKMLTVNITDLKGGSEIVEVYNLK